MRINVSMGEPVIVAQAAPEIKGWGPYQFPWVERLADGALHAVFWMHADSAKDYGLSNGHAVSRDGGQSWQPVDAAPSPGGLLLPNGDRLLADCAPSIPVAGLSLPRPVASHHATYVDYDYYAQDTLPADLARGWPFLRLARGESEWKKEWATVRFTQAADVRTATEDVLVVPFFEHNRIRVAVDGTLRATLYAMPHFGTRNKVRRTFLTVVVASANGGRTWREVGAIPYQPDLAADPHWDDRDGFSEPQVNEMPDGSLFALLRTDDGNGPGPLYAARSPDRGVTWSRPSVFDDRGVWPQLVTLASGITLASYGRPGLYLRATRDPDGQRWAERLTVVAPDAGGSRDPNTCSYSGLMALSETRALLVYSNFRYPNEQGQPCKTLLSCIIEAHP